MPPRIERAAPCKYTALFDKKWAYPIFFDKVQNKAAEGLKKAAARLQTSQQLFCYFHTGDSRPTYSADSACSLAAFILSAMRARSAFSRSTLRLISSMKAPADFDLAVRKVKLVSYV